MTSFGSDSKMLTHCHTTLDKISFKRMARSRSCSPTPHESGQDQETPLPSSAEEKDVYGVRRMRRKREEEIGDPKESIKSNSNGIQNIVKLSRVPRDTTQILLLTFLLNLALHCVCLFEMFVQMK